MRLVECPSPKIGRPLLIIPIGSTEQHGPHLPMDTDTQIAVEVATRAVARVRPEPPESATSRPYPSSAVMIAPPVAYGSSGEHQSFAGTLSIGNEVLTNMLIELGRSARQFCRSYLWVNGHGGNHRAVQAATKTLSYEGDIVDGWWPQISRDLNDRLSLRIDPLRDSHAGFIETSVMMAIDSRLAAPTGDDAAGVTESIDKLWPALHRGGVAAVSTNGVLGDPRNATTADGQVLLEEWSRDLASLIETQLNGPAQP